MVLQVRAMAQALEDLATASSKKNLPFHWKPWKALEALARFENPHHASYEIVLISTDNFPQTPSGTQSLHWALHRPGSLPITGAQFPGTGCGSCAARFPALPVRGPQVSPRWLFVLFRPAY